MPHRTTPATFARNILIGAGLGAAVGVSFLFVGFARLLLVTLGGARVQPMDQADIRLMEWYVGGFALAGAFLGLVRPLLRTRVTIYAAAAVAGGIAMNVIMRGDQEYVGMDRPFWITMTVVGMIFGVAGAYGFLHRS